MFPFKNAERIFESIVFSFSSNLTFNPNGVYLSIINDNIKPAMRVSYEAYEKTFGPIIYQGTYCAAKSAGII